MNSYKNIEFAKGYKSSFADFIKEFGKAKIFRDMQPEVREKELKKAWKIATNGNVKPTVTKSKKANTRKNSK